MKTVINGSLVVSALLTVLLAIAMVAACHRHPVKPKDLVEQGEPIHYLLHVINQTHDDTVVGVHLVDCTGPMIAYTKVKAGEAIDRQLSYDSADLAVCFAHTLDDRFVGEVVDGMTVSLNLEPEK